MCVLLGPHFLGDARHVIPAARGLDELAAAFDHGDLARDFIVQRAAHAGKAIHVLDLDFGAEFLGADGAHADVYVAAHHAFFHVAIAHAAVDQNIFEGIEIFIGHVGTGDVRFGNDFHERHAGAVEIHAAGAVKMRELAHVFFEVRARDADAAHTIGRAGAGEFKIHEAVRRAGFVVLRELVIFGGVGIEITFAVEFGEARNFAVQQVTRQHRQTQRLVVRHGQHAGQAEADGTDVGVRLGTVSVRATAPHLRFGFELDVGFQTDDSFVFHCGENLTTAGRVEASSEGRMRGRRRDLSAGKNIYCAVGRMGNLKSHSPVCAPASINKR